MNESKFDFINKNRDYLERLSRSYKPLRSRIVVHPLDYNLPREYQAAFNLHTSKTNKMCYKCAYSELDRMQLSNMAMCQKIDINRYSLFNSASELTCTSCRKYFDYYHIDLNTSFANEVFDSDMVKMANNEKLVSKDYFILKMLFSNQRNKKMNDTLFNIIGDRIFKELTVYKRKSVIKNILNA